MPFTAASSPLPFRYLPAIVFDRPAPIILTQNTASGLSHTVPLARSTSNPPLSPSVT